MAIAPGQDIQSQIRTTAAEVNGLLEAALEPSKGVPDGLAEAMRYSLLAGGKRLRPALVLWSCEACGGDRQSAIPAALAIECIHTFSLIHDDLPAIDNDDFRRGHPTNHKVYGEAQAILAGDGLHTLAFDLLTQSASSSSVALAMVRELASATGWKGMIGGEFADVEGESAEPSIDLVRTIHAAKTARLIQAPCRLGALAAEANEEQYAALSAYGHALGLAFQASDDLLDVTGSSERMGKKVGKDEAAGKQTYPRVVGIAETRKIAEKAVDEAIESLAPFGPRADRLVHLARFVIERDS